MEERIQPVPLGAKGRLLVISVISGLLGMWMLAVYAYLTLPQEVPVHFGFDGEPTRYGDKSTFLILTAAFSIAPVIFILLTKYRFTLINRHPYLVNLPAFFTSISKIPEERRGLWVNRYFEGVLYLGAALTFSLLIMEIGIYAGKIHGKLPSWFMPFSLSLPVWLILPFLLYLRRLYLELERSIR
ncbi:MAG: DUF1648 domain-containing protein [Euryarchaeota archaeon]|nr:DUF1648 domain-containing protein [Euryarchaeota archaeon]